MLTVVTYWWGAKYGAHEVRKLMAGLHRGMQEPFRFMAITDNVNREPDIPKWEIPEQDLHLTKIPGCLARLRLFDPEWQQQNGILEGSRIVCIDLDVVVTGDLYPLLYRAENFMILQGANASNPCPYNGSIWMLRAGYRPDVWSDFSLEAADKVKHAPFADDQSWFAHKLPNSGGWQAGPSSGVYAFKKPGWPEGDDLPKGAALVVFPGWRSPDKFTHLRWIREHWR